MSFGGGGGSGGTNAHTHNSALANDGGSLDSTLTQIDDTSLYSRILIGC